MVVALCWRVEWNSKRVISLLVYRTPPQSISGSQLPRPQMEKLFITFLLIFFIMYCWTTCVMATILQNICYTLCHLYSTIFYCKFLYIFNMCFKRSTVLNCSHGGTNLYSLFALTAQFTSCSCLKCHSFEIMAQRGIFRLIVLKSR